LLTTGGRGQQQITVKHVTVNADQAVVAENITTAAPALQGNAPVYRADPPA
jgi:hypothetical protein